MDSISLNKKMPKNLSDLLTNKETSYYAICDIDDNIIAYLDSEENIDIIKKLIGSICRDKNLKIIEIQNTMRIANQFKDFNEFLQKLENI